MSFLLAKFTDAFRNFARFVGPDKFLEPVAGIRWYVDVAPVTEFCSSGCVHLLIEAGSTVVFYTILDGSNCNNK